MRKIISLFFIFTTINIFSQEIMLTKQNVKIKKRSKKELFFAFHQGDIVRFNVKTKSNKKITLFSVTDVEKGMIMNQKSFSQIDDMTFYVPQTSIYNFSFVNDSWCSRSFEIEIHRKPSNPKYANFNSTPKWIKKIDTTYNVRPNDAILHYDTLWRTEPNRIKDTCYIEEKEVYDRNIRLEAAYSLRKNHKTVVEITLGKEEKSEFLEKTPTKWGYWIGSGEEAQESWKRNVKNITKLSAPLLTQFVHPVVGFIVGVVPDFILPVSGKNVSFWWVNDSLEIEKFESKEYKEIVSFDSGKNVVAYQKHKVDNREKVYVLLMNESVINPIEVNLKLVVLYEVCKYKIDFIQTFDLKPIYKRKKANKPIIRKYLVPIIDN
ncbi:MAG: hypothetical protein ACOXZK_07535 [Bacteroidales bacterium]|jgi:hypothetical protein|nr:hypothetical protein [Bacteroidales bacterium]